MKKYLPIAKKSSGYTLIELMVVITIIAILAIIGLSLYVNAQKNARDGIRSTELGSLARSIETTKNPVGTDYLYTSANYDADYPQNKPADPLKASVPFYCISTGGDQANIPDPSAWGSAVSCPTDLGGGAGNTAYTTWNTLVDNSGSYNSTSSNALATGAKRWKICAKREASTGVICVKSMR